MLFNSIKSSQHGLSTLHEYVSMFVNTTRICQHGLSISPLKSGSQRQRWQHPPNNLS